MPSYDRYILSDHILDLMAKAPNRSHNPKDIAVALDKTLTQVRTAIAKMCMQKTIHPYEWSPVVSRSTNKGHCELLYRIGPGNGVYPDREAVERAMKPTRFTEGGWPWPDDAMWNGTCSVFHPNTVT